MARIELTMDEFCDLARETLDALPAPFHAWLENVVVDVEDWPSRHTLRQMDIEDRRELFGLFEGAAITEQEYGDHLPNRIWLYKRPIEIASHSREEVAFEIRRTVLHELAHHFGYSEADLEEFESRPTPFDEPDA